MEYVSFALMPSYPFTLFLILKNHITTWGVSINREEAAVEADIHETLNIAAANAFFLKIVISITSWS